MKKYTLEAALAAGAKELKNQKGAKAKRIVMAADMHLRSYQAARKIDNGAIGAVGNFGSQAELLLYVEKQMSQAEEVVVLYEAGPLGYGLYRALKARGVRCYVCAPDSSEQKRKRRKNNAIDTRTLTSNLFNYLNGNERALQLVRVPTEEQEQARLASRQHDQLVEERKRLGAKGNALLLSQGYGSWKNWWRPKVFSRLSQLVAGWLKEMLQTWIDLLQALDEKIRRAKAALAKRCSGPRPKGAGATSLVQLQSEVLDWGLYPNRRKIGCLAGMVPSEWSTGDTQWRGSITKVGVPTIRRIITEMVWRMILFQPQYKAVQKWQEVLRGTNRALKKKAVVAIGRQLMVDLWRLQTGRISAQELNLVMIGA
jgi:Transposase and inactivated derivatives